MSVSNLIRSKSFSAGGAAVGPYTFSFSYDVINDLKLTVDGVASTDFTVSPGEFNTGTILPAGAKLVFYRETSLTQEQSFPTNTTPAAADVAAALDKLTMVSQEQSEVLNRTVKSNIGAENDFVTSSTIGLDANGKGVARTIAEEVLHLGITDVAADAAAAAVSAAAALASANSASSDAAAVGSPVSYAESQTLSTAQQGAAQTNLGIPGGVIGTTGGYGSEHIVYIAATTAVSDGASNSSQVIQDALDLHGDEPARIVFPAGGNYMCKNLVLRSNTTVELTGCTLRFGGLTPTPSGTGFGAPAGQAGMFWVEGTFQNRKTNIHIIGGTLNGGDSSIGGSIGSNDAIQMVYTDNVIVEQVHLIDWNQDGMEFKSCNNLVVSNNIIENIWDAAVECRGGRNVKVYNNVMSNCAQGFMTKPHESNSLGTGTNPKTYATDYHVYDNEMTVRTNGILNNWANASTFERNIVYPEVGYPAIVVFDTKEHPASSMGEEQYGITFKDNVFIGDTTNTFMRIKTTRVGDQVGNELDRVENNNFINNSVEGQCGVGFEITGICNLKGNILGAVTGNSIQINDAQGEIRIEDNIMPNGIVRFQGGAGLIKFNRNITAAVVQYTGTNVHADGNDFYSYAANSGAASLVLRGSVHSTSSTTVPWISNHCVGATIDGAYLTTTGTMDKAIQNNAPDVNISNFRFDSTGQTDITIHFLVSGVSGEIPINCNISNGTIINRGGSVDEGIRFETGCDKNSITNVNITGVAQGIRTLSDYVNITGCRVSGTTYQEYDIQGDYTFLTFNDSTTVGTSGYSNLGGNTTEVNNRFPLI
jgi:hypothetical protein